VQRERANLSGVRKSLIIRGGKLKWMGGWVAVFFYNAIPMAHMNFLVFKVEINIKKLVFL